jgi:hypothetical protein
MTCLSSTEVAGLSPDRVQKAAAVEFVSSLPRHDRRLKIAREVDDDSCTGRAVLQTSSFWRHVDLSEIISSQWSAYAVPNNTVAVHAQVTETRAATEARILVVSSIGRIPILSGASDYT